MGDEGDVDINYTIRVINHYDGNKVYTIEKYCKTYGQIMQELEAEGVETREIQLCNVPMGEPGFVRHSNLEEIEWSRDERDQTLELFAYERVYPVKVTTFVEGPTASIEKTDSFNFLKTAQIREVRRAFEDRFGIGSLPEINYRDQLADDDTLESIDHGQFLDNDQLVLVGKITVNVMDEKCDQVRHIAASPHSKAGHLWKEFMRLSTPPRWLHTVEGSKRRPLCREDNCDGPMCPHTWLVYNGRCLRFDDILKYALELEPGETLKLVYHSAPPFPVTIKEKNEKNEIIETRIEIEDSNTIAEVRNKYSRQAEEGLIEGDLLMLEDQELKDERKVFTYTINSNSAIFVRKRSANQPMFTYICADCGNDLRLRKDEKIRCRECGHRVVYKPRLNKPLQHFAR